MQTTTMQNTDQAGVTRVTVDPSATLGPIRPMNAVNNGPKRAGPTPTGT